MAGKACVVAFSLVFPTGTRDGTLSYHRPVSFCIQAQCRCCMDCNNETPEVAAPSTHAFAFQCAYPSNLNQHTTAICLRHYMQSGTRHTLACLQAYVHIILTINSLLNPCTITLAHRRLAPPVTPARGPAPTPERAAPRPCNHVHPSHRPAARGRQHPSQRHPTPTGPLKKGAKGSQAAAAAGPKHKHAQQCSTANTQRHRSQPA